MQSAERIVRELAASDRRFCLVAGAQWEGELSAIADTYTKQGKPKIEVNKTNRAITRLISEYRNNRVRVLLVARDPDAAGKNNEVADVATGMLRSDEQDSCAAEAYDNAFEEAVTGGFGAWRLRTEYEDELDEDENKQRVCFEPIFEADRCVYFDPNSQRKDKSDAKYCFVVTQMDVESFKAEYDQDPQTWPLDMPLQGFIWYNQGQDFVHIAEYYEVEARTFKQLVYRDINGKDTIYRADLLEDNPALLDRIEATNSQLMREEKKKERIVKKYVFSGGGLLEKPQTIAGRYIPIIPLYGKRWYSGGVEHFCGEVRHARHAQTMQNAIISEMLFVASKSSNQKAIFLPEEIQGHERYWQDDPVQNYTYLTKNAVALDPSNPAARTVLPMQYTPAIEPSPVLAALHTVASTDLQEILGRNEEGAEVAANISGKAIDLIQQRVDMQSFLYTDNAASALRHSARVWLEMTKDITTYEREKVKTVDEEGTPKYAKINQPYYNEQTGDTEYHNDITNTKFDIVIKMGASSEARRSAMVQTLTQLLTATQDPEAAKIIMAQIMMNLQAEGMAEMQAYWRKQLVAIGALQPNDEEKAEMEQAAQQEQQPDPNAVYLLASAEKQKADAALAQAKIKLTEADTLKTMAEVEDTINSPVQIG